MTGLTDHATEYVQQMIKLSKAFAQDDSNEINEIRAEMGSTLTDDLVAAAAYGQFEAYNDLPPEKKNASPAVPKDKIKAAKEKVALKKASTSTAAQPKERIREGPNCA